MNNKLDIKYKKELTILKLSMLILHYDINITTEFLLDIITNRFRIK